MKLVIGTRHWLGAEWTHCDIDPSPLWSETGYHPVDIVCHAKNIELPDQSCELVYSQECLEHFPRQEYQDVLREWCRLVAPGGLIRIEVPDFLACMQQCLSSDSLEMDRAIQQLIFGGQINQYDFHYIGLTPRMLQEDMEQNGLKVICIKRGWEHGWLLVEATR